MSPKCIFKIGKKLRKTWKKKKLERKLIEMEETNLEKVFKEFKDYANQASKGITNQEHDQNNIIPQKLYLTGIHYLCSKVTLLDICIFV